MLTLDVLTKLLELSNKIAILEKEIEELRNRNNIQYIPYPINIPTPAYPAYPQPYWVSNSNKTTLVGAAEC